jgi:protein-disulfide isomerase
MGPVDEEDLTRKQRREQARAERKALEEAEAASAARRKRLTQLGAVVAVVVVAIVIILIASGGGSGGGGGKVETGKQAGGLVNKVEAEVGGGIPQNGNTIGAPAAPVTLQYFGDLQCPICKDFTLGALPTLLQKWVRAGKLRIEYRSLETATREREEFKTQQVAALAAGKQNKMWQYIELFYRQQGEESSGYVTEKFLQGLAQQVPGLNLPQWTSDRGSATLNNEIATDAQAANNAGFNGTPSFLIGKTGGKMEKFEYTSLTDPTSFNEAIEKVLKG